MSTNIADRHNQEFQLKVNEDGSINTSLTGGGEEVIVTPEGALSTDQRPFQRGSNTFAIAVTTSASTAVTVTGTGSRWRIVNAGDVPVAFFLGTDAPVFPVAGANQPLYVIPAGAVEVFEGGAATAIRTICGTGTSTLYVCRGTGV